MHQLNVREQVRLPFLRCVELVMSGIQFRLFRASITVIIVALAVAFLVTMLSNSLITREVAHSIEEQTSARKKLLFWASRLSTPLTEDALRSILLDGSSVERQNEIKMWAKLGDQEITRLRDLAEKEVVYIGFFRSLDRSQLQRLVGNARDSGIFGSLSRPGYLERFEQSMAKSHISFPTPLKDFRTFLAQWNTSSNQRTLICEGHGRALQGVQQVLKSRTAIEVFAEPDKDLHDQLAKHDFLISQEEIRALHAEASNYRDSQKLEQILHIPAVRQRLSIRIQKATQDIEIKHLYEAVGSRSGAQWLKGILGELGVPLALPLQRILQVSDYNLEKMHLAEVESKSNEESSETGFHGFSQRILWLLCVSFLVCVVGITNAMLMSVTERFREIATMKCLGATDGFVMGNFLLESCVQGLAGGLFGATMGAFLGLAKAISAFGWIAAANIPYSPIILLGISATVVGIFLSGLAAVYPAWVAARLAPLEAMRVE